MHAFILLKEFQLPQRSIEATIDLPGRGHLVLQPADVAILLGHNAGGVYDGQS